MSETKLIDLNRTMEQVTITIVLLAYRLLMYIDRRIQGNKAIKVDLFITSLFHNANISCI